jgi:transcriptional regulator with XRE-family HTH domain
VEDDARQGHEQPDRSADPRFVPIRLAESHARVSREQEDRAVGLPERRITVNQLIALNMAYYRREAGLTQEKFGELLGGWTKVAVSAAERSWDGKRVRKFDGDEIADIAAVLGVPIAALFLPPEDDLEDCRYVFRQDAEAEPVGMGALLSHAIPEPTLDDTPTMGAYEDRLVEAIDKYFPSEVSRAVATRLKERATEEQLMRSLRAARRDYAALAEFEETVANLFSGNELLQNFLIEMLNATPEGQALIDEEERSERGELTPEEQAERHRVAWEHVPAAERDWQTHLAAIGRELYGERGPAMRGEVNQVIAEARKRGFEGFPGARVLLNHDGTYELVQPPGPDGLEAESS